MVHFTQDADLLSNQQKTRLAGQLTMKLRDFVHLMALETINVLKVTTADIPLTMVLLLKAKMSLTSNS